MQFLKSLFRIIIDAQIKYYQLRNAQNALTLSTSINVARSITEKLGFQHDKTKTNPQFQKEALPLLKGISEVFFEHLNVEYINATNALASKLLIDKEEENYLNFVKGLAKSAIGKIDSLNAKINKMKIVTVPDYDTLLLLTGMTISHFLAIHQRKGRDHFKLMIELLDLKTYNFNEYAQIKVLSVKAVELAKLFIDAVQGTVWSYKAHCSKTVEK